MQTRAEVSQEPGPDQQSTAGRRFALDGRVAIVTGGAGALGSEIAVGLAQDGADVAVTDLRQEAAGEVAERIGRVGRRAFTMPCDVRDAGQVGAAVAGTVEALGRVDIVVHTAGVAKLPLWSRCPSSSFTRPCCRA